MPGSRPAQALAFSGPLVEAQLAWSALKGHGIEAFLLEQYGVAGWGLPRADVVVLAEDLERALALLDD